MNSAYENIYHRLEDENWWFKARQDFFAGILWRMPRLKRVLDIGCGGGGLLESLNSHGIKHTYGIDISLDAVSFCEKRGLKTFQLVMPSNDWRLRIILLILLFLPMYWNI